ncbi:probable terpene synthase 4 isoform X2 [Lactuca sativa]|uniref:probable terpene synthase 4 isoform X2 n=1 Tax=Lactuca sativa TaxID=4236 RepID=UPI001C68D4E1|nr:probable terpene synthase 4 isoform X2 [Lactuca sativa]
MQPAYNINLPPPAMNNSFTKLNIQHTLIPTKRDSQPRKINFKIFFNMEQPIKYSEHLQEVRNLLKHVQDEPLKSMDMVNALQKLCINHHFKEEIDSILKTHYTKIFNGHVSNHDQSLYEVSINFRILRQQGYYIPADDVFAGFKQKNGIFLEEMTEDVKGLMTLYEASQLSIEGEHILEEAADFSSHALKEMIPFLDQDEAIMVKNTLEHSYQKTSSTFMVKKFIKHYSGTTMSQLAEMELAKLQALHRTEVTQIFRWDVNSFERLPYHLRICIEAVYNITHEISDKIYKKYGFNPIEYIKRTWINLCEAFLVEAKWFAAGHLPNVDEYLRNGIVSSGAEVVTVHMFFLLGCATNEDSATIIKDNPGITFCLAKILRLWDDLGSAKDENQDGHDGSYVTYYMRENEGCSLENAQGHVMSMISNTWKQLNKECLSPNKFSAPFIQACLNLARMVPMMYNYDENHSLPLLKYYINSMF